MIPWFLFSKASGIQRCTPAVLIYLTDACVSTVFPMPCGLWGLILVATSRRECTLPQSPTHPFGRKKPSGERVGKLSYLTAGNTYVTEKGAVILLCCAVLCCAVLCCASVAPFRMAVNPLSLKNRISLRHRDSRPAHEHNDTYTL